MELGTGKSYRSRVEAIAESMTLCQYDPFLSLFTTEDVAKLSNQECVEFIQSTDTIGCRCCSQESLKEVWELVERAKAR